MLLVLVLTLAASPAWATHLLGGEMSGRYLDANGPAGAPLRYEVTVSLYNNCASSVLRAAASVGIYDLATGSKVELTALNYAFTDTFAGQTGFMSIPQTSITSCIGPAIPPGCTVTGVSQPFRLQRFVGVVNLPASSRGYYALFTDGNRNVDVTNLAAPGNQALSLYAALNPPSLPNSSPVFSDLAVAVICANDTTYLLNNAVDADGDRLVYTFGQPYGIIGALGALPPSFSPPPNQLDYQSGQGYSPTTPLGTAGGNFASLNPATGIAKYKAGTLGTKYVVAVDVGEYRVVNGQEILVGTTRRDLQLVVANCPLVAPPVLAAPIVLPRSYTVEAGSSLSVPVTATQPDGNPLTLTLNSVLLDGPGGFDASFNGSSGTVVPGNPSGTASASGTGGSVAGTLVFNTRCTDARAAPYDVALTVRDNGCGGKTAFDVLRITVIKPGPTAISGPGLVCGLNSVQSYAAVGSPAATLGWRVAGGTFVGPSTGPSVQVQWGGAGPGLLVVGGLTQYGCPIDSLRLPITVAPAVSLTLGGGPRTICEGRSTSLTVAGGTGPYTVTGGATPLTGAGPFALSPTQTTTYTIADAASSPTTCGGSATVTVTVSPAPAAVPGAAVTFCAGGSAQLGGPPVAGLTYQWSPATGLSSSTVANPTVTLANATSAPIAQTYTLTTTNATGCTGTGTVVVTANPLPTAVPGAAVTTCAGAPVSIGGPAVAGLSYQWSPATGLSDPTAANPTVTLPNATNGVITQNYTLTTTSAATGCASTGTVSVRVSPLPQALPGAAVAFCTGSSVRLGAAAVAGLSYQWSPAIGLSSPTEANPTVTLTNTTGAPITQTYTLTTTNAAGCQATATVAVTVNPLPVAVPGAAAATCANVPVTIGGPAVAGLSYQWSPATGLSSPTAANPTVTLPNTTGAPITQTYTLTTTNATGCASTGTVAVTVGPALTAGRIGADQAVCPGSGPAPLTSVAGAGGGTGTYAYQWENSTDNLTWTAIAGATEPTYAPGAVSATLYLRRRVSSGSCDAATSNVVTLSLQPVLVAGVALAVPPPQCAGTAFSFVPVPTNAGAAPTYRWFVNGALVASRPTYASTTLTDGDVVRVELTPTPGFCASGPAIAQVTISRTPVPPPSASISVRPAVVVCPGKPLTFSLDNATNAGPGPQYQWLVDGVPVAGATGPSFVSSTLREGQLVTLSLLASTVCGPVTVRSNAVPAAVLAVVPDVEAGPDKTIMAGDEVTLEGTANGSFPLVWTPTTGLRFVGNDQLRPVASPAVTTTYTLTGGAGDCTDRSSVTVTVTPRLRIPNAFSPNGDGQDDTWQIENIEAYPASRVLVFNRWGSKIYETTAYSRATEWPGTIGGQPAAVGTYYYVITLGNGKSYSGPLTVVY